MREKLEKNHFIQKLPSLILAGLLIFQLPNVFAQDGELLFKSSCIACHTIGKGRLVGPDLSGMSSRYSEKWLISFIKSSKSMIDNGDRDAVAISEEYFNIVMPDFTGSEGDIKSIIEYINKSSDNPELIVEKRDEAIKIWPGDADTGRMYFEGSLTFENKGASCLSCHHISYPDAIQGGLLAKDLSMSFKTTGGEAGINAMLATPPFPAMTETYKDNVLTAREITHLTMYLKATSEQTEISKAVILSATPIIGLIITAFLFVFFSLIWAKRKKESVNKSVIKRQLK